LNKTRSGLAIRRVPIDGLHNDPANARLHDRRNLDAITSSLKQFGQVEPLVVQKGTNVVIGGNGRLAAMKAMGLAECDVVEIEADRATAAALGVALNRTAELASWDDDALAGILESLESDGFDAAALGFDDAELAALIGEPDGPMVEQHPTQAPPRMAWVLLGIPTVRFGEIAADVERLAATPGIICETTANDGPDEDQEDR
jgi:ParB-like chromosome segregation protein Spo0J